MKFNTFYPAWDESFAFILPELPKPEDIEELKVSILCGAKLEVSILCGAKLKVSILCKGKHFTASKYNSNFSGMQGLASHSFYKQY